MKKHCFHLVNISPWPFLVSLGILLLTSGLAFFMHRVTLGGYVFLFGLTIVVLTAIFWFRDVIEEASFVGFHTLVVKRGLVYGFFLFILSEIMLFFGFFWAFFHSSLSPSVEFGNVWPSIGVDPIKTTAFPLFNTALLIISGFAVTWTHRATSLGLCSEVIDSLIITIFLGLVFIILQSLEYYEATYNLDDCVYSCVFYTLTGLHGCHVIVGVSFLSICLARFLFRNFTTSHYLGFIFAIWYWHFVDAVWIFLFIMVYGWGNW